MWYLAYFQLDTHDTHDTQKISNADGYGEDEDGEKCGHCNGKGKRKDPLSTHLGPLYILNEDCDSEDISSGMHCTIFLNCVREFNAHPAVFRG